MSTKKKILMLTDWYEPGYKAGGPIQSCRNFVAALHDTYELSMITSDRDHGDAAPYPGIATDTWISREPGLRIYYAGPLSGRGRLKALIDALAPDYIYLNSMYSYRFTLLPLWWRLQGQIAAGIVLAPRGMLQEGAMQFKSLKKKLLIRLLNGTRLPRKLVFQATDEQEKKDIGRYFPTAGRVAVAPNFTKMDLVEWKRVEKKPGELHCVMISRIAPKKNLLFLLNVLKEVSSRKGPLGDLSLRLDLFGEIEDAGYWEKCLAVMEAMPTTVAVAWRGPIPNGAVTAELQRHQVFVLPTLGENFGHAIFEALLAGRPVVISDKTPWRGLEARCVGYDLPLNDHLFAQTLERLAAMDQETYEKWSRAAYDYAEAIRSSEGLKEKYRELFP